MANTIKITHVLEATGGGTRRHLRDLVFNLDREQFEISVICSPGRESGFETDVRAMRDAGVQVCELPMSPGFSPLRDLFARRGCVRFLREIRPDIVHTHSTKAGWIGRQAAQRCGIRKRVHSPHCWPFEIRAPEPARWLVRRIERRLARSTTAFVCCCEAEKASALRYGISSADKLHVVPNGIPVGEQVASAPAGNREACVIGVVGRLCTQKGQDWFLGALAPLVRENSGIQILFAGDGPAREKLTRLSHGLGIADQCRFAGLVENPRDLYGGMDMVVLPSRWEGLPYVLLEAMQAGRAVIATAVGGMVEPLAADGGILIPCEDAEQLRQAVRELVNHPDRRLRLGRQAAEAVARYSLTQMVYDIQDIYQKREDTQ